MLRITPLLLLLSTSCLASGFYVGGDIGPESADFNETSNIFQPGNFNVSNTVHKAGSGYFASLFAGLSTNIYNAYFNQKFYIAAEANANATSVEYQTNNNEFIHHVFGSVRYKLPYNFGISLLPGIWFLDNTLFYARVGVVLSHFEVSSSEALLPSTNQNLDGFRGGFGIRRNIGPHLSVRFEGSQVVYRNDDNAFVFEGSSNTHKKTVIEPKTLQAEFGIVYEFGKNETVLL